jgi:hypothetical protein
MNQDQLENVLIRMQNKQTAVLSQYIEAVRVDDTKAINEFRDKWDTLAIAIKGVQRRIQLLKGAKQ